MKKTIFKVLLLISLGGIFGKHVHVKQKKTWLQAQDYCRQNHTDLSSISNPTEKQQVIEAAGSNIQHWNWIGLYREANNPTSWKWSGGGYALYQDWVHGEPNKYYLADKGFITSKGWYDYDSEVRLPFFCFHLIVVQEEKTWEEALEYCREHHTDLTSLLSETEVLLARREIQEEARTEHVWTGLRYLANQWLWVNGDPLEYEAWGTTHRGGDGWHQCPTWNLRCGAMMKEEGGWKARHCQERLNFICY